MRKQEEFILQAESKAFNQEHHDRMVERADKYEASLATGISNFSNLSLARHRAAYIKWKVAENLDKYLIDFESNVIKKGGKVLWADTAEAAIKEIESILVKHDTQTVLKSKSELAEEIDLKNHLQKIGITTIETEFGEFVAGVSNEKSYHVVNSIIHKSKLEITQQLNAHTGTSIDTDAKEILSDVSEAIRSKYISTSISITGANFLFANEGMVGFTENEGNIGKSNALAKVHIVLAGIDKILPSINDAELFFSLLSTYATGQKLATYNSIIGPKTQDDVDGPDEFIIILIDNGRSNVLAQQDQRQALSCIKCGACSNVCPVFQNIGGHTYGNTNKGPIGAVVAPLQFGMDEYKHLSYASSACGKCTEVCPVNIDIHNHLIRNRKYSVQSGLEKNAEKIAWYSWKKLALSRKNMNKGTSIKGFMLKSFFKSAWGNRREFPKLADKSFNQLWREEKGLK